ncbi:hypothetical protein CDAR_584541 [Caerostris darwini]|uniref:Uncharacterized protein n=1 Tax=Caerostris darwini TaxID=1538125 RepID=A0AAV4WHN0_9ARAC|nr:hypothetical protein CDAR_584541 [Caerostris darwini]
MLMDAAGPQDRWGLTTGHADAADTNAISTLSWQTNGLCQENACYLERYHEQRPVKPCKNETSTFPLPGRKINSPGRGAVDRAGGDLLRLISGGEEMLMDDAVPQRSMGEGGTLDTRMQRTQTQIAFFLGRRMASCTM